MQRTQDEQIRAQSARSDGEVELRIRYLGPSAVQKALDSGEMRIQTTLRVRYEDSCNVVGIGWRVAPSPGIFVQLKRNPGKTTSAECGSSGYVSINPSKSAAAPRLDDGKIHVLAAKQSDSGALTVTADGTVVWEGQLPAAALSLKRQVGFRTDNGRFDLELKAPGHRADPQPPQSGPGETMTTPTINHFEQVAPDRIVKTRLDGRDVYAFTVKPGDVQEWDRQNIGPGGKPNSRAEISYAAADSAHKGEGPYTITDKTGPQSYAIGLNFAAGWPNDQRWATMLQFHQQDGATWGGFGGISVHGNTIDIGEPNSDDVKYLARLPIVPGRWYDLKLEVNWSSGPDGYVRVFHDGAQIAEYHGMTIPPDQYRYIKQGYYRDGAITEPGTVYQTQVSISEGVTVPVTPPAPPVILPPAPPAPPAALPGLSAKAQAGLDLLIAELPFLDAQIAALMDRRAKVQALLDKGPWS